MYTGGKINGSIRIVIPDLHKIDARFAVKSGVIEIKTLLFCDDLIPVPKIQIQIPACPDKRVHLAQNTGNLTVCNVGQGIARGCDTVEQPPGKHTIQHSKICLMKLDRESACGGFCPAFAEHGFAQIGAGDSSAECA